MTTENRPGDGPESGPGHRSGHGAGAGGAVGAAAAGENNEKSLSYLGGLGRIDLPPMVGDEEAFTWALRPLGRRALAPAG
ncbi:hypothetical protein FrEUN1fDRAFT_5478, partial [Parafrankia sp. EUN1f]